MNDRAKLAAKRLAGFFGNGEPAKDWPEMQEALKKLDQIANGVGGAPPVCEPDKARCLLCGNNVSRCPAYQAAVDVSARIEDGRQAQRDGLPREAMPTDAERIGWDEAAHDALSVGVRPDRLETHEGRGSPQVARSTRI